VISYPIHHIGLAVHSIAEAAPRFELLKGGRCSPVEEIPSQGVRVAFLGALELLEPLSADSPVGRFLERRGSGVHHLAFEVPNLEAELARLAAAGFTLIDTAPRVGSGGHRVAFLHPHSTEGTLIELVEPSPGAVTAPP
jgi:methylmalonyl-CoA/ethylmalonyl-CoA epimerase